MDESQKQISDPRNLENYLHNPVIIFTSGSKPMPTRYTDHRGEKVTVLEETPFF